MKRLAISLLLVSVLTLSLIPGCSSGAALTIYHAGSLTIPFDDITKEFNKLYPDIRVQTEASGSVTAIRKVTQLGKKAGIIASADYTLIPEMMFSEYAEWYIIFATNQMVIAYTDNSLFGDEINRDNWHEILQRDGVKYGRSDPDQDPNGYRTLMVWQLAEDYYNTPALYGKLYGAAGELIRPKEVDLIALLESGDLDYAFNYLSVARQHKLNFVELPSEINLSSQEFKDYYSKAKVEIAGKKPGETITKTGKPIVYGITIPKDAPYPELAVAWINFLLSSNGMAIIEANGQPPIIPAVTNDRSKLPDELSKYVTESN
jgi:molybdate/tungstate transport system substrate-binding protein